MKRILSCILSGIFIFYSCISTASSGCDAQSLAQNPQSVIGCYIASKDEISVPWIIDMEEHDKRGVTIETYNLTTQQWPKTWMSKHEGMWKQRLVIYRPDIIKSSQALLFVDGSYNPPTDKKNSSNIDFAKIALETNSVVVDLFDVPNQSLTLDDDTPRKEDDLVAYTWVRYLNHPFKNSYWPLQVPMTKSIVKAMDAVQQILSHENDVEIKHFVVSGVSKRGWATWLTALEDNRVNAIVPIVINTLNMKDSLTNIYSSYNNKWPPAFHDYVAQGIPARINTAEFSELIKITDPIAYLDCKDCDNFKKRLSIPKYIINASSDEFFVPDSLNMYLKKLPGETDVRIAPNQGHNISQKIIQDALLTYYETIVFHASRPHITWKLNKDGLPESVTSDATPTHVKLWEAENPKARDFRLSTHIAYTSQSLRGECPDKFCKFTVAITPPKKGWKASFIELTYEYGNGQQFVLTTPAYITTGAPVFTNTEMLAMTAKSSTTRLA